MSHVLESIIAPNVTEVGQIVEVGLASGKLVMNARKRKDHSRNVIHSSNALQEGGSGTIPDLFKETKGFPITFKNFVKSALNLVSHVQEHGELIVYVRRKSYSTR